MNESDSIDDIQRLRKSFIRFSREPGDDVGGDRRTIESRMNIFDHAEISIARVLPVHSPEDRIRSALERKVKMWDDLFVSGKNPDQVAGQIARFKTAKPQAVKAAHLSA